MIHSTVLKTGVNKYLMKEQLILIFLIQTLKVFIFQNDKLNYLCLNPFSNEHSGQNSSFKRRSQSA